jgi:DNA-binding beta-propeller fold protein YncE
MRHAAAALIAAAVLLLALAPAALGTDAIYWANYSGEDSWGEISVGDLDGNGADFSTPGATVNGPVGVAVDPAAGQIYWANSDADTISSASIYHPGGAHDLVTTGATVSTPQGVAVDPAAGRVYWHPWQQDFIRST